MKQETNIPNQIPLKGNLNFGKFFCITCGKEGTLSETMDCPCEKHNKVGRRFIDRIELWKIVSKRDGDFLVKIQDRK